jgi:hypothetical protein
LALRGEDHGMPAFGQHLNHTIEVA